MSAYIRMYREECHLERIPGGRIRELLADGNGCMVGRALADKFGWRLCDTVPLVSPIYALPLRLSIRCIFDGQRKSDEMHLIFPIRQVQEGGAPMSDHIARKVVQYFNHMGTRVSALEALAPREAQVLEKLAGGASYKEVADQLSLSIDTVRMNVRHIYHKLHVHSRGEAVAKYLANR